MRSIPAFLCFLAMLFSIPAFAQEPSSKLKDSPDAEKWEKLIGEWTEEYQRRTPDGEWKETKGQMIYEWELDGAFLKTEEYLEGKKNSFMFFGYDGLLSKYTARGYNSNSRQLEVTCLGWNGNILIGYWNSRTPEDKFISGKSEIKYDSNFKTNVFEASVFIDGEWMVISKGESTKVR